MENVVPGYMGYDRTIVVFSPDGRLFQVEYASEAIKRGTTILGVAFNGGVMIAGVKLASPLSKPGAREKIYSVDDHIGIACSGLWADARILVDFARVEAQKHRITFEEPIDIYTLAKNIADRKQLHTMYAGMRPFGVGTLVAGLDGEARLFETEPSGTLTEWNAHVIGRGTPIAEKILQKKWKEGMKKEDALKLVLECLSKCEKKSYSAESIDIGVVAGGKFGKMSVQEVADAMKKFG